jgi:hypothetical protein
MQSRSRSTLKQATPVVSNKHAATSAVDSLRAHESMAALMPTVMRTAAIQKDCATTLSGMFATCAVLRFDSGQLVLSAPNAAMLARLKQQLPKLQDALCMSGWEVSAIRLKVQPAKYSADSCQIDKQKLAPCAVEALAALEQSLGKSPRNEALRIAIGAMVQRHRKQD